MNKIFFKLLDDKNNIVQVGLVDSIDYLPKGCVEATEEEYNNSFDNPISSFSDEYILQSIRQEKNQQMSEECSKIIQKPFERDNRL